MLAGATLVCDASVIIAALDRSERDHAQCVELLVSEVAVVVPAPAIVEVDWLTRSRGLVDGIGRLLESVDDRSIVVADLDHEDYRRVRALLSTYADLPLEFVDAAVIAIAERLEQSRVATLDRRHFSVVRPLHVEAFELVP